ncbi:protein of unknown function (plasmid) [Cupriavidus taiwanensis]|nr:protein of unknown function [Cupriavidus taiwanensis]
MFAIVRTPESRGGGSPEVVRTSRKRIAPSRILHAAALGSTPYEQSAGSPHRFVLR